MEKSFCYHHAQGEITEMFIREDYRGNGYAKLLLESLETRLRDEGVEEVKIITGKSNIHAQRIYERSNYARKEYVAFQKNWHEQV